MGVTVVDHAHEAPLVLPGLGRRGQTLVMQNGVVVFEYASDASVGWRRAPLSCPVLDLGSLHVPGMQERATCWAPACERDGYAFAGEWPQAARITVVGDVEASPNAMDGVVAAGGGKRHAQSVAGWAVECTRARQVRGVVLLEAEVAALGSAGLLRLVYSLFVTLAHPAVREVAVPSPL
ncbi:hypothetical protein [Dyella sp. ASV21]|jgi:hypothetical protein|uniref:hypothetical protein n=1 Tax=Dyella sp. ASV21 TaxID=2795114 RepID=UPI0018ED1E67|nr:hypothetical protein [Dyella sp. ASV21]